MDKPSTTIDKKPLIKSGFILGAFALVCTLVLAFIYDVSKDKIAYNQKAYALKALQDIVPASRYDNDLLNDTTLLYSLPDLGSQEGVLAYRARKNGNPVAVIFSPVAREGYNGNIKLLVGINHDGSLAGVRVIDHRETPGLGDVIELDKSNWLYSFDQKSLNNPTADRWGVKPDGGEFDAFSGATITPRAIVKAVHHALQYYEKEKDNVFK